MAKGAKIKLPKMAQTTKIDACKIQSVSSPKHFTGMVIGFSEIFRLEKFCDVKLICQDSELMAHRLMLGSFSPFLRLMMEEKESRGENVVTIHLPLIKGYHMKLVLDYIYGGSMYLCGAHMKYIIQVMEVLQLECGISVNKMVLNQEADKSGNHWMEIEQTEVKLQHFTPGKWKKEEKDNNSEERKNKEKESDTSSDRESDKISKVTADTRDNNTKDETKEEIVENVEGEENSDNDDVEGEGNSDNDDALKDNDDAPVMVELDERFVVEYGDDSQESGEESKWEGGEETKKEHNGHRCLLCRRSFKHYWNLQVHLKGHVGVKVHLHRCDMCKKNFRNKTEHDLHQRSHQYAKALGKVRLSKTAGVRSKIITTAGSQDKKIVRKYSKTLTMTGKLNKNISLDASAKSRVRLKQDSLTCPICDKSFGVKSLYLRHVRQRHSELADTLEQRILLQRKAFVSIKNVHFPHLSKKRKIPKISEPESPQTPARKKCVQFSTPISSPSESNKHSAKDNDSPTNSSILSPSTPQNSQPSPLNEDSSPGSPFTPCYPKLSKINKDIDSSPGSPSNLRYPKQSSPKKRKKSSSYCDLTCPDCDRNFPAKSIFERHLQSAKHGEYSLYSSDGGSPYQRNTPSSSCHWSQQMIQVGDKEIPKIECHLCNSTFARVKDLAKHREKVCVAWLNPGN